LPAAITGLGLAILLGATYGPQSLIRTLLPTRGMASYSASHYGFFRQGMSFLYSRDAGWLWYLASPAGIWIAASLWLLVRGAQSFPAFVAGRSTPRQELTLTCALLHVVFVLIMFGNSWSWPYYFFVLVIGSVSAVDWGHSIRIERLCVHGLVAFSLLLCLTYTRQLDAGYFRDPETGLWWPADESHERASVMKLISAKRSALMVESGVGGALIAQGFQKPVVMYLLPDYQAGSEPDREATQLKTSNAIVTTVIHPAYLGSCLNYYPKLRDAFGNARVTFRGKYFIVYERPSQKASAAARG
jgi:hypothetical protein